MSHSLIQFLDKSDCQTHALKICEDAAQQLPRHLQLKHMSDIKFLRANYVSHKAPDGTAKVVLRNSDPEAELEEAVWEMQGVLLDYDLPPVLHRNRLPGKPIWAKQSVHLLGFSSSIFERATTGIAAIHHLIDSVYSVNSLRPWVPDQTEDHPSFTFSNRYVTALSQSQGHSPVPFGDVIDPQGILLQATSNVGAHLEDNKVEYYEKQSDTLYDLLFFISSMSL
ncbi:hypothetical protein EWM64_g807 [Hericium alpestre]|uniref:Uncharacterized protein n=1 Tax=Hericium alpestre TaxID=135208 RepID=A0A4Z0AA70_9AGAM|nr:hypothetical protein EWM64_g807 [Hericium alpestre]